ncbi:MAG: thermonuclease family protein [Nitrospinae bacterium]|nr:thermonuclease family protein [Nitrospinota bacterium]
MKTKWVYILLSIILLSVLALPLLTSSYRVEVSAAEDVPKNPDYVFAVCQDVADGNTIEVDILGMKRKLRLIGVDVGRKGFFEGIKKMFGMGAASYLEKTVKGKKLYLEFEDNWADPSGILRAYVHLKEGDTFINLEMIKLGYASADRKSNYKYKKEFEKVGR